MFSFLTNLLFSITGTLFQPFLPSVSQWVVHCFIQLYLSLIPFFIHLWIFHSTLPFFIYLHLVSITQSSFIQHFIEFSSFLSSWIYFITLLVCHNHFTGSKIINRKNKWSHGSIWAWPETKSKISAWDSRWEFLPNSLVKSFLLNCFSEGKTWISWENHKQVPMGRIVWEAHEVC